MTSQAKAIIGVLAAGVAILAVALGIAVASGGGMHSDDGNAYFGMADAMHDGDTSDMMSHMQQVMSDGDYAAMATHMETHQMGSPMIDDPAMDGMIHRMMDGMMGNMMNGHDSETPRSSP